MSKFAVNSSNIVILASCKILEAKSKSCFSPEEKSIQDLCFSFSSFNKDITSSIFLWSISFI